MDSIRSIGMTYSAPLSGGIPAAAKAPSPGREEAALPADAVQIGSAPAPDEGKETVKITVIAQDPAVAKPKTIEIPKEMIGSSVSGPKMYSINSSNPKAIPDLEGNYLYELGTPQFDQVNSYATSYNTFNMLESMLGRTPKWAFGGEKLGVNPHKREGMNAYYSRNEASVNFFYFDSKPLGKTVQTSQSTDIVSHEVGHSFLDAMKPGYLGWDTETMSVHEGLADTTATLFALTDDDNVREIIAQTGGDLKKPNLLSKVGEEFGIALAKSDKDPNNDDRDYLRTLINGFKYVDPSTLPPRTSEDKLANECHSFSRILSGANYDMISAFYETNLESGMSPEAALKKAGTDFGSVFYKAVDNCPSYKCKYKDVALNMLKADKALNGGKHCADIEKIFLQRNVISEGDIKALDMKIPDISVKNPSDAGRISSMLSKHGKELGIEDGASFSMGGVSENMYGGKSVSLTNSQDVELKGSAFGKYQNCFVSVNGELKLDFDKDGKLVDFSYDKIDSKKISDVKLGVIMAAKDGKIMDEGIKSDDNPSKWTAKVMTGEGGKKFIERLPVIE